MRTVVNWPVIAGMREPPSTGVHRMKLNIMLSGVKMRIAANGSVVQKPHAHQREPTMNGALR